MTYASRIISHSKKLKHVTTLLRREHAVAVRGFSNSTQPSLTGSEDLFKIRMNCSPVERISKCSTTNAPVPRDVSAMRTKPMAGPTFFRGFTSSQMRSGNIARWLKKEGDKVAPGEVLCEVETDKATVEMECMEEGYLAKIVKEEGAKEIQVGEVIAITVEDEEDIQKFKDYTPSSGTAPAAPEEKPAPSPPKEEKVEKPASTPEAKTSKSSSAPSEDRIFASPLAKKLAEDSNVPLSSIKGTGPEGRIVKADVEEFLASRGKETTAKPSKPTDSKVPALDYVDIPHTQIRKAKYLYNLVTASRLAFSKQTIPHYYLTAAALALRKVPQCNSSWTDEYIRQFSNVNINVAVQTENGLYVPVVKDADKKGLSTIGEEVRFLAQKAKENSLKPGDYEGGTFTVSNLGGPFGIKQFCAVINPPQAAILAIGSAEKRVVAGSGPDQFNVASYMSVTLSCDHRVIDGAIGAEWLKAFKGYIETPESMLL
ncbi:hypothetical protein Bca4012_085213 [Brassica carinata]